MKKVIALALIFIMCFTSVAFADMQYIQKNLTEYGIITDYSIEGINRAEAAKIIVTMLGYEVEATDTVFDDVKKEYWASGYIDFANKMGIISGHGDGTFTPEEPVTNEQFVKMLVCVLGYQPRVHIPYPTGHFMEATRIGITKDLELVGSDVAKRSDVAVMVFNALDICVMKQNGFGEDISYIIMDGKGNYEKITLRMNFEPELRREENPDHSELDAMPLFNGPEYTSRLVRVENLSIKDGVITFNNSLDENDKKTYIIDEDTYSYVNDGVSIYAFTADEIENGIYVQCWHKTADTENARLLKAAVAKKIQL